MAKMLHMSKLFHEGDMKKLIGNLLDNGVELDKPQGEQSILMIISGVVEAYNSTEMTPEQREQQKKLKAERTEIEETFVDRFLAAEDEYVSATADLPRTLDGLKAMNLARKQREETEQGIQEDLLSETAAIDLELAKLRDVKYSAVLEFLTSKLEYEPEEGTEGNVTHRGANKVWQPPYKIVPLKSGKYTGYIDKEGNMYILWDKEAVNLGVQEFSSRTQANQFTYVVNKYLGDTYARILAAQAFKKGEELDQEISYDSIGTAGVETAKEDLLKDRTVVSLDTFAAQVTGNAE